MNSAVIGGILSERQFAIQIDPGNRTEAAVFSRNAVGAALERFGIFRGPPVAQIALAIEPPALIVEAVGQLVSDHYSDSSVIHGIIAARVVKRGLQNASGEIDI